MNEMSVAEIFDSVQDEYHHGTLSRVRTLELLQQCQPLDVDYIYDVLNLEQEQVML